MGGEHRTCGGSASTLPGMTRGISNDRWRKYEEAKRDGASTTQARAVAGISHQAARDYEAGAPTSSGFRFRQMWKQTELPDVLETDQLGREARRALNDFGYFRERYLGRYSRPWMIEAADTFRQALDHPDRTYMVVNAPPGAGKTTLFTCDIPLWLICRNRGIRIMLGSSAESLAIAYARRIRRELERPTPLHPPDDQKNSGAIDAVATVTDDYGRFKPLDADVWRAGTFVVAQVGDALGSEKEHTVTAYGRDSGFLGGRFDFVMWDDLVTSRVVRSQDQTEQMQEWWDNEAETRLEPGGLLVLQGQRMGANDLYRYCLDKQTEVYGDDNDSDEPDRVEATYASVVYATHYDHLCDMNHRRPIPGRPQKNDAKPYPDGCLLDPWRISWKDCRNRMYNAPKTWRVQYQQEDVDPSGVLVQKLWINGGDDEHGSYIGCLDKDRTRRELPAGLSGDLVSVCTVDPSPTKFWSIQWWVVQFSRTEGADGVEFVQRFLMDHERARHSADEFLDKQPDGTFSGIAAEWQRASADSGHKIKTWIIEKNAAQRFMLQYSFVREWMAHEQVAILPHETGRNKSDPEYGVDILGPTYRNGLVRLPYRTRHDQEVVLNLTDELTRYPDAPTDDCVMSNWFLEWNLRHLRPKLGQTRPQKRPSWLAPVRPPNAR